MYTADWSAYPPELLLSLQVLGSDEVSAPLFTVMSAVLESRRTWRSRRGQKQKKPPHSVTYFRPAFTNSISEPPLLVKVLPRWHFFPPEAKEKGMEKSLQTISNGFLILNDNQFHLANIHTISGNIFFLTIYCNQAKQPKKKMHVRYINKKENEK